MYIGAYTLIGPFVYITDNNHTAKRYNLIKFQRSTIKSITIGADVWIESGAKILAGITSLLLQLLLYAYKGCKISNIA